MAKITEKGVEDTPLSEWVKKHQDVYKSVFGDTFNIEPETPQGQIIANIALASSQEDEAIVDTANASDIYTAQGKHIDYIAENLRIKRKKEIPTQVMCVFTGKEGTKLPAGTKAKDVHGNKFSLESELVIQENGRVDGFMTCDDKGAIVVLSNTLNSIIDVIDGWESVNNEAIGITGQPEENDEKLRARYLREISKNAQGTVGSIQSAINSIGDVEQVLTVDNDQDDPIVVENFELPPHCVASFVLGGKDQEIINAIGLKKPLGIPTVGDVSGVPESKYIHKTVRFYRVIQVEIVINIELDVRRSFPGTGFDDIKNNLVDYFRGDFDVKPGYDLSGASISDNVMLHRLYTPLNETIGCNVLLFEIGRKGEDLKASDIVINLNEIAVLQKENITITSKQKN